MGITSENENTNFTTGKILAAMVHSGVVSFNVLLFQARQ